MIGIGAHVGGSDPIGEADARRADLVQIFLGDPQSWKKPPPHPDATRLAAHSMPVYVHAPYLINPVTDNNRVRIPSRKILQHTCDAATEIGAAGVVVHGGHVTGDGTLHDAPLRWRKALALLDTEVPVLIENTAGGDDAVVRRMEGIRMLWDEIGDMDVGFVLDTCHAWAGGEPLDELVPQLVDVVGRVDLVHCNDSRDPFDSRRDRHANLGAGHIPPDAILEIVRAADAPVILETPGDQAMHRSEIEWLRGELGR